MASKRRNMFHKNKKQETTEISTWASKILGMGMESVAQLGEYILNNNLLPAKEQPPFHNGDSGSCMSSTKSMKLSESPVVNTCGRSTSSLGFKRKLEGEAISSASPVGSQKGNRVKKCSRKGKSGVDIQNSTPATPTFDTSRMHKLPIPRLPKLTVGQDPPRTTTPKRQKPLQPKPTPTEFLENGNSTEQEEELAKYFEGTGGGPKSQLRMLLERNSSGQKKVSFGTLGGAQPSPNTRKKFSFVPISPITPSGGGSLLERMLAQGRSQSVPPPMPPYPTPVEQLEDLQGTTILDPASLSQLFSLIGAELESTPTEEEERSTSATTTTCSSYCSSRGDPVVSAGVSPPPPPLPLLEDSVATGMPDLTLPLVDTFYDFAGEVTHIASCEVPPPDV
ncbi:hypothetical protein AAG570_010632 [Ranatra chinensis]|uniref:Uncharacterized protein n=1 Tax=Ranatra chinensis TaxID=642074 RepID=A0ABD0YN35_9HEMI